MTNYILRRLIMAIPVVVLVSLIVFGMVRVLPGDLASTKLGGEASEEEVAQYRTSLGFDKPLVVQYLEWSGNALKGDFGDSMITNRPTLTELKERIPVTFELALIAILASMAIGITVGTIAAVHEGSVLGDYVPTTLALLGLAIPGFWLATLVITFSAIWWGWSPPLRYESILTNPGTNLEKILPAAAVLCLPLAALTTRMTRASVVEVLRSDHIRTARAKGLSESIVIRRHGLRTALVPVITVSGNQLAALLGGTVIIEQIFLLPGLGKLTFDSISQRDYTQLQASIFFFALIVVLVNLLVDLSYGLIDPRVRYS
ncbi:MAG: ABC transporter permease [Dehalococcoidia bacterium]